MEMHAIFGSDSDDKRIRPGLSRAKHEIPDLEIQVYFASADNCPEKVERIMNELRSEGKLDGKAPLISGAGMSNQLTGSVKRYCGLNNLLIGVSLEDPQFGGLTSILSTAEKPPLNPVLSTGLNNSYAAANIAARFTQGSYEKVILYGNEGRRDLDMKVGNDSIEAAKAEFEKLGIPNHVAGKDKLNPDDLVVTVFTHNNRMSAHYAHPSTTLREVDKILRKGKGIQVGVREKVREKERIERPYIYMACFDGTEATGFVSAGWYKNAAQVAAQIMGYEGALEVIKAAKSEKREKLEKNGGYRL